MRFRNRATDGSPSQGRPLTHRCAATGCVTGVLATVVFLTAGAGAKAQTRDADQDIAASPQPVALPPTLQDITGVREGMTSSALVELGMEALRSNRLEDARKILLAVIAEDADNLQAMSNLAFAYERSAMAQQIATDDPEAAGKAERFLDQAVDVYLEAAKIAIAKGQNDVAEQMYNRVLMRRPAEQAANLGLGRVYAATNRQLQAVSKYRDYVNSPAGKKNADAMVELAELYLADELWRQAMDVLSRAQAIKPQSARIDEMRARAYLLGERVGEAMESAQAAVDKNPREASYRALKAEILVDQNDFEQASIEARRAIELGREDLRDHAGQGPWMDALSAYYKIYQDALRGLLAANPDNPIIRVDLVRAIQEQATIDHTRRRRQALELLQEAPGRSMDDLRILEETAELQLLLEQWDQAEATCKRIRRTSPGSPVAERILNAVRAHRKETSR